MDGRFPHIKLRDNGTLGRFPPRRIWKRSVVQRPRSPTVRLPSSGNVRPSQCPKTGELGGQR
jgi:hypothetical protein